MRRRRTARDAPPDFSRLVWMAKRRGPAGRASLQVLQDTLMVYYEKEFQSAREYAKAKEGYVKPFVVFRPDFERSLRKHREYHGARPSSFWPFVVRYGHIDRDNKGIVVWSANKNFNVPRIRRVRRRNVG